MLRDERCMGKSVDLHRCAQRPGYGEKHGRGTYPDDRSFTIAAPRVQRLWFRRQRQ